MNEDALKKLAKAAGISPEEMMGLLASASNASMRTQKAEDGFKPGPDWVGRIPSEKEVIMHGAEMPPALRAVEKKVKPDPAIEAFQKETGEQVDPGEGIVLSVVKQLATNASYWSGPPWHVDPDIIRLELSRKGLPKERIDTVTRGTAIYYTERAKTIWGAKKFDEAIAAAKKLME